MSNSTVAKAFVAAKKAFGPALMDKTNLAFRSKYADLGACLEAVEDALLDNGIALYQETFEVETGVTVETVLLHESGESIRCGKLHVPASKQDPQGYGSALTYARRYSLCAACGIAPEDDDGNAASKKQEPVKRADPKPANKTPATTLLPHDVAKNVTKGVNDGDAAGAAQYLHGLPQEDMDEVWKHLVNDIQDKLTAAWPGA